MENIIHNLEKRDVKLEKEEIKQLLELYLLHRPKRKMRQKRSYDLYIL